MTFILVFGTSTTYGAWDSEGGWVQRLTKYLDNKQLEGKEHPTDPYYVIYTEKIVLMQTPYFSS